ncbi:PREDICTED: uncharacterized protein LOC101298215 isoform 1 [Fragaria vesca subsp. vesca]
MFQILEQNRPGVQLPMRLRLILGFSVFLSGILWILPRHSVNSGFDAKESIKLGDAGGYFVNRWLFCPCTKIVHLTGLMWCLVSSDPVNVPILPVSISVLRSSLVELFLKQSTFGRHER